jgi:hypothetical protein
MYVSSKAQKEMAPTLAQWLLDRSVKAPSPADQTSKIKKAAAKSKPAKREKRAAGRR